MEKRASLRVNKPHVETNTKNSIKKDKSQPENPKYKNKVMYNLGKAIDFSHGVVTMLISQLAQLHCDKTKRDTINAIYRLSIIMHGKGDLLKKERARGALNALVNDLMNDKFSYCS